jgi:transposase
MTRAPHTPSDWREGRRLRAWELKQQGWTQQASADALGVTAGAVSQWMRRAREGGGEALRRRVALGPTPKLTDAQREQLPTVLAQGVDASGLSLLPGAVRTSALGTPTRASGPTSSTSNWATSAATTSRTREASVGLPPLVCATSSVASKAAVVSAATIFRQPYGDQ